MIIFGFYLPIEFSFEINVVNSETFRWIICIMSLANAAITLNTVTFTNEGVLKARAENFKEYLKWVFIFDLLSIGSIFPPIYRIYNSSYVLIRILGHAFFYFNGPNLLRALSSLRKKIEIISKR